MKKLPINYLEIEEIFLQTLGKPEIRSVAITSSNPSEGVSTVAYTLSKRSSAEGRKTLLVELNMLHPELSDISNHTHSEWDLVPESANKCIMSVIDNENSAIANELEILPAPSAHKINSFRSQEKAIYLLNSWYQNYDSIIFDTSPLNARNQNNIPAENICSIVDGTVVVVLAGETKETTFNKAIERLKKNDVNILGVVFNDQNNPRLSDEIIRETKRFDRLFPKTMAKIQQAVRASPFFNIEI